MQKKFFLFLIFSCVGIVMKAAQNHQSLQDVVLTKRIIEQTIFEGASAQVEGVPNSHNKATFQRTTEHYAPKPCTPRINRHVKLVHRKENNGVDCCKATCAFGSMGLLWWCCC
jgi:hypothetical protein